MKGGQIMKKILKSLVIGALALNLVLAFGSSSILLTESKPEVGISVNNDG
jgi:hypothetical protein